VENFEEVYFGHKGKEYYAKIEIDESNEWRVMKVYESDEPEIWEEMEDDFAIPANVTKAMVVAIEEFLES